MALGRHNGDQPAMLQNPISQSKSSFIFQPKYCYDIDQILLYDFTFLEICEFRI